MRASTLLPDKHLQPLPNTTYWMWAGGVAAQPVFYCRRVICWFSMRHKRLWPHLLLYSWIHQKHTEVDRLLFLWYKVYMWVDKWMCEIKVKIINCDSIITLSIYCIPLTLLFVCVFLWTANSFGCF